jgi:hypothetical protein
METFIDFMADNPTCIVGLFAIVIAALYGRELLRDPRVIIKPVTEYKYKPEPPLPPPEYRRVFEVAHVDPAKVTEFQAENPGCFTIAQWRALLSCLPSPCPDWREALYKAFTDATMKHPNTTPLFRLVEVKV